MDGESMHTEHILHLCKKCNGTGIYEWEVCVDYHKNDYETEQEVCSACNGTGRLVETYKWSRTYEPYDSKEMALQNMRVQLSDKTENLKNGRGRYR